MIFRLMMLVAIVIGAGCASLPQDFDAHPTPLVEGQLVDAKAAIVLVGISGPSEVNYLQFLQSSLLAINVRFKGTDNAIVAVQMPVGLKAVRLSTITLAQRPGLYFNGMRIGFITIHAPPIDLDRPGVYYLGTVDTSRPGDFSPKPDIEQLARIRVSLAKSFSNHEPVNFKWPEGSASR